MKPGNDNAKRKLIEIITKIQKDIDLKEGSEIISKDSKMLSLTKEFNQAKEAMQVLRMNVIQRQMDARVNEMMWNLANKKLDEYYKSGAIDGYLPDADHFALELAKSRVFIICDALDSALNDVLAIYESCGFSSGELGMQRKIREVRKYFDEHFRNQKFAGTDFEEMVREEGDRIYNCSVKRSEVLNRKAQRLFEKKMKQKQEQQQAESQEPERCSPITTEEPANQEKKEEKKPAHEAKRKTQPKLRKSRRINKK